MSELVQIMNDLLVVICIAFANGLHIPPIVWVIFGLEFAGRLLNMWLKD